MPRLADRAPRQVLIPPAMVRRRVRPNTRAQAAPHPWRDRLHAARDGRPAPGEGTLSIDPSDLPTVDRPIALTRAARYALATLTGGRR